MIDTETVSSFHQGVYLDWTVAGNVRITITRLAGNSAVLSGIFLDPAPAATAARSSGPDNLSVSSAFETGTAGTSHNFTVTALNSSGGIDTNFTGTVSLTSSDPKASLPASYTFTTADAGVRTFTITFLTAGIQSVTATDLVNQSISGFDANIAVGPAATASLLVTGLSSTDAAGASEEFTVTAYDPYGNVATGFAGTVQFSSSDPNASLPSNYTFTTADAGMHTFTVTFLTPGVQSVTATDVANQAISGSDANITVEPSAIASLSVTGISGGEAAGASEEITVTAYDSSGNVATGFAGTVQFSSSDPRASLPSRYTFTRADGGVHTFAISLKTAGVQSVTASDIANPSISASESNITVEPAAAASLFVTGISGSEAAGTSEDITVTAYDSYGNVATGYAGTVQFSSSDPRASLPSRYTFTGADGGVHTFTISLKTAGAQSVTATDISNPSISGTESNIALEPAAASSLVVIGFPSTDTAGAIETLTVTAYDPYGNIATSYLGTIRFASTDHRASLPGNYTFTWGDAGVHTFTARLETAGVQSITVTDTANQLISDSESPITVKAAAASSLVVTGFPAIDTAGVIGALTVTAYDPYGNVATGFAGTIRLSSSDGRASLPASFTFTPADAGVHTFTAKLNTAGTQSVTATDTANRSISGSESNIWVKPAAKPVTIPLARHPHHPRAKPAIVRPHVGSTRQRRK